MLSHYKCHAVKHNFYRSKSNRSFILLTVSPVSPIYFSLATFELPEFRKQKKNDIQSKSFLKNCVSAWELNPRYS